MRHNSVAFRASSFRRNPLARVWHGLRFAYYALLLLLWLWLLLLVVLLYCPTFFGGSGGLLPTRANDATQLVLTFEGYLSTHMRTLAHLANMRLCKHVDVQIGMVKCKLPIQKKLDWEALAPRSVDVATAPHSGEHTQPNRGACLRT